MALFSRRKRERTIYFPWERRGLWGAMRLAGRRVSRLAIVLVATLVVWLLWQRNDDERRLRITREALSRVRAAVDAFRADHEGRCPASLADLASATGGGPYLTESPRDGWAQGLRYVCPATYANRPYDLLSDGPDGLPYGLDRIE